MSQAALNLFKRTLQQFGYNNTGVFLLPLPPASVTSVNLPLQYFHNKILKGTLFVILVNNTFIYQSKNVCYSFN